MDQYLILLPLLLCVVVVAWPGPPGVARLVELLPEMVVVMVVSDVAVVVALVGIPATAEMDKTHVLRLLPGLVEEAAVA